VRNKQYFLKKIRRKGKLSGKRYDERQVKKLIVLSRLTGKEEYRKKIMEQCYPIIFSILEKVGSRIRTNFNLFNNEDLFSESIIVIDRCINSYSFTKKTNFLTFIWISITRNIARFLTNNIYDPSKISNVSFDELKEKQFKGSNISDELEIVEEECKALGAEYFQEIDFLEGLSKKEKKLINMRCEGIKVKTSCSILKINQNEYYEILKNVQRKVEAEL
jgi:DNA-directed RNA polymerase specialized sigma subunit